MRPEAIAIRCVLSFAPTSTMWAATWASKWLSARVIFLPIGRYHKHMRVLAILAVAAIAVVPRAWAQALPDLGGSPEAAILSPQMERRLGESIMRDMRRDPSFIDDPEISEYLGRIGSQIAQAMPVARQDYEFFAVRDTSINAFSMPGG